MRIRCTKPWFNNTRQIVGTSQCKRLFLKPLTPCYKRVSQWGHRQPSIQIRKVAWLICGVPDRVINCARMQRLMYPDLVGHGLYQSSDLTLNWKGDNRWKHGSITSQWSRRRGVNVPSKAFQTSAPAKQRSPSDRTTFTTSVRTAVPIVPVMYTYAMTFRVARK